MELKIVSKNDLKYVDVTFMNKNVITTIPKVKLYEINSKGYYFFFTDNSGELLLLKEKDIISIIPEVQTSQNELIQCIIDNQYYIPKRILYNIPEIRDALNKLNFGLINSIYHKCVDRIIKQANEKNLFSGKLALGRGLHLVTNEFIEEVNKFERKYYE